MNFNLFSIIAASAVSATVALPAAASVEVSGKKSSTSAYTHTGSVRQLHPRRELHG